MSIAIEKGKCIGCGRCAEACPGNLLVVHDKKASIRDSRDCWGCTACVKACPVDAISFYLAAGLGGTGGRLYAKDKPDTLTWELHLPDGQVKGITVNKRQSNAY